MKILSSEQIRKVDDFTIKNTPISSIDLMENAAMAIFNWIKNQLPDSNTFHVFCGPGNNGGDGLALARLLYNSDKKVKIYLPYFSDHYSKDNLTNQERLPPIPIKFISPEERISLSSGIIIDAILGSGLSRPVSEVWEPLFQQINKSELLKISIDIPSGLFAETNNPPNHPIIEADYTLAFQIPKLAFFLPQNELFVGKWHVLNIGLDERFIQNEKTHFYYTTNSEVKPYLKKRTLFSHKGSFGHALIIAGSYGKIGAALLATKAASRSGVGLITAYAPKCGYDIIQLGVPEAMCLTDSDKKIISDFPKTKNFQAVAIGPGLGLATATEKGFLNFLAENQKMETPLVLDADALNILSRNKEYLNFLPKNTVLTPHIKEFKRLVGDWNNDYERLQKQIEFAKTYDCILILKGAYTSITCPNGEMYFNSTGNPGMATGGSGDVLTGLITGLLAQGYSVKDASILGVYLHGLAGDFARENLSEQAMKAGDIIDYFGTAWKKITC